MIHYAVRLLYLEKNESGTDNNVCFDVENLRKEKKNTYKVTKEHAVHVCCLQTGFFIFESRQQTNSMYIFYAWGVTWLCFQVKIRGRCYDTYLQYHSYEEKLGVVALDSMGSLSKTLESPKPNEHNVLRKYV